MQIRFLTDMVDHPIVTPLGSATLIFLHSTPPKTHTNPRNSNQQSPSVFNMFFLNFKFFVIKLCVKMCEKHQNEGQYISATKKRYDLQF